MVQMYVKPAIDREAMSYDNLPVTNDGQSIKEMKGIYGDHWENFVSWHNFKLDFINNALLVGVIVLVIIFISFTKRPGDKS